MYYFRILGVFYRVFLSNIVLLHLIVSFCVEYFILYSLDTLILIFQILFLIFYFLISMYPSALNIFLVQYSVFWNVFFEYWVYYIELFFPISYFEHFISFMQRICWCCCILCFCFVFFSNIGYIVELFFPILYFCIAVTYCREYVGVAVFFWYLNIFQILGIFSCLIFYFLFKYLWQWINLLRIF